MATRKYASLIAMLVLLNGIVYFYYQNNIHLTDGSYIYPLDDTYIHLAVAKNIAFYNNWGVVHDEFSSSSSSPVYTLMLSVLMRIFGDSSVYPLLINIFFGNAIICLLFLFFRRNRCLFFCSCLFLFAPVLLHIQILSGMEHTLHIFLIIAAFMLFYKHLETWRKKYTYPFLIITGFLCLTRYESMFFIIPIAFVLLLHKQYKFLCLTCAAGFLPVLIFGLYSIAMGGFFLPNSLLVKGAIPFSNGIFYVLKHFSEKIYSNLFRVALFVPITISLVIMIRDFIVNKQYNLRGICIIIKRYSFLFIIFAATLLHGLFAKFGWLYRYEAYLLALLYISLIMVMGKNYGFYKNYIKNRFFSLLPVVFIALTVYVIAARIISSDIVIRSAGKNIYDQQIQMGRFLHTYYNESKVIANDIGAITYYTKIDLLDLVGLGSNSVIHNKIRGGVII